LDDCNIKSFPLALAAYNRAETDECKTKIHDLLCKAIKQEEALKKNYSVDILYKSNLKRKCPRANIESVNLSSNIQARLRSKFFVGCVFKEDLISYIENFDDNSIFEDYDKNRYIFRISESNKDVIDLQLCIDICLARNKYASYNHPSKSCICLAVINENLKNDFYDKNTCLQLSNKNGNSNKVYEIYETGFLGKFFQTKLFIIIDFYYLILKRDKKFTILF
jgi:hypothetical protein